MIGWLKTTWRTFERDSTMSLSRRPSPQMTDVCRRPVAVAGSSSVTWPYCLQLDSSSSSSLLISSSLTVCWSEVKSSKWTRMCCPVGARSVHGWSTDPQTTSVDVVVVELMWTGDVDTCTTHERSASTTDNTSQMYKFQVPLEVPPWSRLIGLYESRVWSRSSDRIKTLPIYLKSHKHESKMSSLIKTQPYKTKRHMHSMVQLYR